MVGIQFIKTPKMHSEELHLLLCYLKKIAWLNTSQSCFLSLAKILPPELNMWITELCSYYMCENNMVSITSFKLSQMILLTCWYPRGWILRLLPPLTPDHLSLVLLLSLPVIIMEIYLFFYSGSKTKDVFCELAKTSCFIMTCQNFSCNFTYLFIFTV